MDNTIDNTIDNTTDNNGTTEEYKVDDAVDTANEQTERIEQIQFVLMKLRTKLSKPVDSPGRAKLIKKYFNELRQLIMMDMNEGIRVIFCDHFVEFIISRHESILYFAVLADGFLRCLLPILRSNEWNKLFVKQLLYTDGIAFLMAMIRKFHGEPNIIVQCIEVMSTISDFIIALKNNTNNDKDKIIENPLLLEKPAISEKDALGRAKKGVTTPKLTKSKSSDDFLHQLIMHGGATLFPALMIKFTSNGPSGIIKNELGIRRLLFISHFLVRNTNADFAVKIATSENNAYLISILKVMSNNSRDLTLASATLLLGLISAHVIVADAIARLGGMDMLSSALVQNIESFDLQAHAPNSWIRGALEHTLQLEAKMITSPSITAEGSALSDSVGSVTKALEQVVISRQKAALAAQQSSGNVYSLSESERINQTPASDDIIDSSNNNNNAPTKILDEKEDSYYMGVEGLLDPPPEHADQNTALGRLKYGPLADHAGADFDHTTMDPKAEVPKKKPIKTKKKDSPNKKSEEINIKGMSVVAETLFTGDEGAAAAAAAAGDGEVANAISKLNYAERLQVMILQVQQQQTTVEEPAE